jgi:hypothetical protein
MQSSLLERFRNWGRRSERSGNQGLPNLGVVGTLLAVFVCMFLGVFIADSLAVIIAFGPHAYFADGVRIINWRNGILSNGGNLPFALEFARRSLWFFFGLVLIGLSEFLAGFLRKVFVSRPR